MDKYNGITTADKYIANTTADKYIGNNLADKYTGNITADKYAAGNITVDKYAANHNSKHLSFGFVRNNPKNKDIVGDNMFSHTVGEPKRPLQIHKKANTSNM